MAEFSISLSPADINAIADAVVVKLAERELPATATDVGKVLWREPEAAKLLGISAQMLKRLRLRGYIKAATNSKPVLYRKEHIDAAAQFLVDLNKK